MVLGLSMFAGSVLFMVFHGIGIGPACFLIPSEIFPIRIRGVAMGIAVSCNWGANVLVAFLFPIALPLLGVGLSFGVFFLVSLVGWAVFYFWVPETRGVSLEDVERNLIAGKPLRHLGSTSGSSLTFEQLT